MVIAAIAPDTVCQFQLPKLSMLTTWYWIHYDISISFHYLHRTKPVEDTPDTVCQLQSPKQTSSPHITSEDTTSIPGWRRICAAVAPDTVCQLSFCGEYHLLVGTNRENKPRGQHHRSFPKHQEWTAPMHNLISFHCSQRGTAVL